MNLSRYVVAACAVLIAGCHTTDALRTEPPSLELSSLLSAKTVATCISQQWKSAPDGHTYVSMIQSGDAYSLSMINPDLDNTLLVADVKDNHGGSVTRYVNGYLFNGKKYDQMVTDCQTKAPQ